VGELHRASLSQLLTNWRLIPPAVDGHVTEKMLPDLVMPQAAHSKLKFRINKVRCVEDTTGFGSDEIFVGANFIDETGDTSYYYFKVSDDFDDGELVDYGFPGKEIQVFNLKEGGDKFPKLYVATVSMIEQDWGKVSSWFQDLADKINASIKKSLKAAGIALGSLIGLGELGGLLGSIAGTIHDWLVGWIVGLFENDYMGSFTTKSVINSYTGNWSSTGTVYREWSKKFVAHGGHYHLWYTWELAA
jgi:hypothetical protein